MERDWGTYFKERVAVSEAGCWEWQGARNNFGYGQVRFQGRTRNAHRLAYEVLVGPIPKGAHVCHHCDNRACVNPEHLFLGTHADNMADMAWKGRGRSGGARGPKHGRAKLTEDQVLAIRSAEGTQAAIAIQFGVCHQLVSKIRRREVWKHL